MTTTIVVLVAVFATATACQFMRSLMNYVLLGRQIRALNDLRSKTFGWLTWLDRQKPCEEWEPHVVSTLQWVHVPFDELVRNCTRKGPTGKLSATRRSQMLAFDVDWLEMGCLPTLTHDEKFPLFASSTPEEVAAAKFATSQVLALVRARSKKAANEIGER